jgi:hypothetical protein
MYDQLRDLGKMKKKPLVCWYVGWYPCVECSLNARIKRDKVVLGVLSIC